MNYHCPLCSLEFENESCHAGCPMSSGCNMVRCPKCGYEFVEDGTVVELIRRFLPNWRKNDSSANG